MPDTNTRPGDAPQQAVDPTATRPVRTGHDDPAAPIPQQMVEGYPRPEPRRDNQAEAVAGAPVV